jgi:GTPase
VEKLTRAFPKIAHYPFTTLRPHIGHAKFVDGSSIILADLPGIIEGAHENRGLGHQFLQHAERTKVILYVIDGTEIIDNRNPVKDFQVLREELRMYKDGMLLSKPALIVSHLFPHTCQALNKSDRSYTNYPKRNESLKAFLDQDGCNLPLIPISAKEGTNLEVLLESLVELVKAFDKE